MEHRDTVYLSTLMDTVPDMGRLLRLCRTGRRGLRTGAWGLRVDREVLGQTGNWMEEGGGTMEYQILVYI